MSFRKSLSAFLLLLSFLFFSLPVHAASPTVNDEVGLFTAEEINAMNQTASEINQEIKGEIFVVTTTKNSESPETFADNYLRDRVGNDNNGAVLLLDMSQREIYISTSGNMSDYLTDSRIDSILDSVYDQMVDENYGAAALNYFTMAQDYITKGVPGGHYRVDRETGKITRYKVLTSFEIFIALTIALISAGAFFIFIKSRYQLKSGTYTYPFKEKSNLKLVSKEDRLVNSFVTTRRIPKPPTNSGGGGGGSTTHSSGGGTFGGGGRSF